MNAPATNWRERPSAVDRRVAAWTQYTIVAKVSDAEAFFARFGGWPNALTSAFCRGVVDGDSNARAVYEHDHLRGALGMDAERAATTIARMEWMVRDIVTHGVCEPIEVFCFEDGAVELHGFHRFSTAVAAGQATIPVTIYGMGPHIGALAHLLFTEYDGAFRRSVYQPIPHPFFGLLPVHNRGAEAKAAAMVEALTTWSAAAGTRLPFLDCGAHLGHFSRALLTAGFDGEAVDFDQRRLDAQPHLEAIGLAPIRLTRGDFVEVATARRTETIPVLMGLVHHCLGRQDRAERFSGCFVPWMQRWAPVAIVEHSYAATYGGEPAAVPIADGAAAVSWWGARSYSARSIHHEPTTIRETFFLERT